MRGGLDVPSHTERRLLRYTPAQLFDLVVDVERYPEFVPWVAAAHILRRDGNEIWVEMTIGTRLIGKRFVTKATLTRPRRIDIGSLDPLFERYEQNWTFHANAHGRTAVEYHVEFKFSSRVLEALLDTGFSDYARAVVGAFRRRARQVYGTGVRRRAMS